MARRYFTIAAVLAGMGILGFVAAGPVFGVYETTPALNVLHLLAALGTAIAATRGIGSMRTWGQLLGYVFAALAIAGFAADADLVANLLPLTHSNAWVHLVLALLFLYHALLAPPTL
jgi:hypothetical protein